MYNVLKYGEIFFIKPKMVFSRVITTCAQKQLFISFL